MIEVSQLLVMSQPEFVRKTLGDVLSGSYWSRSRDVPVSRTHS